MNLISFNTLPIIDWRMRRHFGPAKVQVSCAMMGMRDWEVVLADHTIIRFGMALMKPDVSDKIDHPHPSNRDRLNRYSELNYQDALRFAEWVNKPAGIIERFVTWWRRRWVGLK